MMIKHQKIALGSILIAVLSLLCGNQAPSYGQSGRVRRSAQKPTSIPVPIVDAADPASLSVPPKPKKPALPEMVDGERIYLGKEVDSKAVILKKPEAGDTLEARMHRFRGTVVLQAILAANGEVTHITVIARLPYGLTEKAIEAARRIKFQPAMKDGKPVSEWVRIEYFSWYV